MLREQSPFHGRRGPPAQRPADRSLRFAKKGLSVAAWRSRLSACADRQRRTPESSPNQGALLRQNAWHWCGLRTAGFLRAAESHAPPARFAQKSSSMQDARSPLKHPTSYQVRCRKPVTSSTVGCRCKEAAASENERPNHSIERTHNGGAQCLAPSRVVPPLCAAHVKR